MKTYTYLLTALLLGAAFAAVRTVRAAGKMGNSSSSASHGSEIEYLKAVNRAGPPQDPQLLFVLMGAFANANQQAEGADFFSARLNEFNPRLNDTQRALYQSAIGLLRAQHASSVPLIHRIGYVKDTIAMLDQAKQLSGGQIFVVNWISGVVRSQLPGVFGQKKIARNDLEWCATNISKA